MSGFAPRGSHFLVFSYINSKVSDFSFFNNCLIVAFLFSIFFSYKNNFNEDLLKLLYEELRETTAAQIVGNGADYGTTKIKKYLNYIFLFLLRA